MAIMYPKIREKLEGAYAEQKVYDALSGLPNDFIIFHSVNWVRKNVSHEFTWYENDFRSTPFTISVGFDDYGIDRSVRPISFLGQFQS